MDAYKYTYLCVTVIYTYIILNDYLEHLEDFVVPIRLKLKSEEFQNS